MNFENYNNIYKEILDDETGNLSANYLLNKYEIKYDEELLIILNQIKKNEYISSDNKIINRLINELDENDNLLDINEIINIKDKVINTDEIDFENEDIEEIPNIQANEIIKDKSKKNQEIINETKSSKNYLLYVLPILILGILVFVFNNSQEEERIKQESVVVNNKDIEKDKVVEVLPKKVEAVDTMAVKKELVDTDSPIEKNIEKKEITKEEEKRITKVIEVVVEDNSNSEDTLNKIEESLPLVEIADKKDSPQLESLSEIKKYVKKLEVKDDKLFFEGSEYSENNDLFGFKIFKITPLYVKFEDTKKNIRNRFLIDN